MKLKMGIRPILFSTPMVQGILDDRKTQTRRELKDQINGIAKPGTHICPYGKVGDVLWVRETHYAYGHWTKITTTETGKVEWKFADLTIDHGKEYYYETNPPEQVLKRKTGGLGYYRRPSIFMPKEAARIFLEINNERMERLKDISRGDCMSEGCPFPNIAKETDPVSWFSRLWMSINGVESWHNDPWVWVIEFKKIEKPSWWELYSKGLPAAY